MAGFFIVEEGPLSGLTVRFEEGDEWLIGRDPETVYQVIEDPMVSRKHLMIRLTDEGFVCENLSAVNPTQVNGKPISEPVLLTEGDLVQVGEVVLRFTEHDPQGALDLDEEDIEASEVSTPTIYDEDEELDQFSLLTNEDARWIVKVISGPNSGAEFNLEPGKSYVLGKDASGTDISFQDLSVSRQHARISLGDDGVITVEDLGSRNGVLVNGHKLMEPKALKSQDVIALGTTTLLLVDRDESRETIYSPPSTFGVPEEEEKDEQEEKAKSWKDTIIPTKHIVLGASFALLVLIAIGGVFSLFKASSVEMVHVDENEQVEEILDKFPTVNYNLTKSTGKIFLIGHVMTEIEHQELMYMIKALPFIRSVDDNVIIDELVWENFNALLVKNPQWRSVAVSSVSPGKFILRGFVVSNDEATKLDDYVTVNFPYLEHLTNDVIVEKTLQDEVQTLLLEQGFVNVTFQLAGGEVILAGRVGKNDERKFKSMVSAMEQAKGIRTVKSFVIFVNASSAVMDLSSRYQVTGTSKFGNIEQYVVINGKILSKGDVLDSMIITKIGPNTVYLEKDGLKYRINYNQQ